MWTWAEDPIKLFHSLVRNTDEQTNKKKRWPYLDKIYTHHKPVQSKLIGNYTNKKLQNMTSSVFLFSLANQTALTGKHSQGLFMLNKCCSCTRVLKIEHSWSRRSHLRALLLLSGFQSLALKQTSNWATACFKPFHLRFVRRLGHSKLSYRSAVQDAQQASD